MEESILNTIKSMLDISEDDPAFDKELIDYINSAFFILEQIGVGPDTPFQITGADEVWSEFIPNISNLNLVKQYVYLRVKKVFDTAGSASSFQSSLDNLITEYEWRLNVEVDPAAD
jgi:hypothetical protein